MNITDDLADSVGQAAAGVTVSDDGSCIPLRWAHVGLIGRLQAPGADFASITAIGPHFCWDETRALSPLPMLSAIAPLDDHCVEKGYDRIGLLGTPLIVPENLDAVGKAYQDMAVSGSCGDATRDLLFAATAEMMAAGASAVALAGTDLLPAFDGRDPGFPVIDALEIHAAVLADLATGNKTLAEAGVLQ